MAVKSAFTPRYIKASSVMNRRHYRQGIDLTRPQGILAGYHSQLPKLTPRQAKRVTRVTNRALKVKVPKTPHLIGAHPLHSSLVHAPTGASLTPLIPKPHVPSAHVNVPHIPAPRVSTHTHIGVGRVHAPHIPHIGAAIHFNHPDLHRPHL